MAGGAVACLLSGYWYPVILGWLGRLLVASDRPERSDAILVLGGDFGGSRVLKGAELGVQGFAPRVLVSGPPYEDRFHSDLAIEFLVQKGYSRDLFLRVPHRARSTIEEALALAPELRRLNVRTAILVTSASHSRRAGIVFALFCPAVRFRSVPAADPHFDSDRWWTDKKWRRLFFSEWYKIVGTVLVEYPRHWIGRFSP